MNTYSQFTIGRMAEICGITPDTIRYYEKIGILANAERSANGHRIYPIDTIEILAFIGRAKAMDFTLQEIRLLLLMADDQKTPCNEIIGMVKRRISAFRQKMLESELALRSLERFVADCPEGTVFASQYPFINYITGDKRHGRSS